VKAMPIYYINLASAPGRRAEMERQLAALGLVAERVEAVTPADISAEDLKTYCNPDRYRWLAPTELACSLSHIKAWRQLLASGAPRAVIFEDDAILSSKLPAFLNAFPREGNELGLVKIEICSDRLRAAKRASYEVAGIELRSVFGFSGGAAGYVISAAIGARIIDREELRHTSLDRGLFDTFGPLSGQLTFLQADPGLAVQADQLGLSSKLEASTLKPDLEARLNTRTGSTLRSYFNSARRWVDINIRQGARKSYLDATGVRKRKIEFLP